MTWRYVDHPENGDMAPANTHEEVEEIAEALRRLGEAAANVWETDDDPNPERLSHDEVVELLNTARPTGEAVLSNGNVIHPTAKKV